MLKVRNLVKRDVKQICMVGMSPRPQAHKREIKMNYCGKFREILENENNNWFHREAEKDERFVIYCIIDNHILFYGNNKEDISPDCVYEYDSDDYKILDIYTGEIFKMELKVVFILEN